MIHDMINAVDPFWNLLGARPSSDFITSHTTPTADFNIEILIFVPLFWTQNHFTICYEITDSYNWELNVTVLDDN